MSADIEKLAVFDSRIVQQRPKYAVDKGALSVTNAPFNAIAATSSQHTYNIYVPSENVFVDRKLQWSSTVFMTGSLSITGTLNQGDSLLVPGRDFSLCALPLNQLCSTLSTTINDTTSVINTQDVLREVLRLTDYKKNRLVRTAPTMLDKYQSYNDAFGTLNNPIGGYDASTEPAELNNGAFPWLKFTSSNGNPLTTGTNVVSWTAGSPSVTYTYDSLNGVPIANVSTIASLAAGVPIPMFFSWFSTEPVCVSPFVFADTHEWDTGLFGINNIQLIMNLVSSPDRAIRKTNRAGRSLENVAYNTTVSSGQVFQNSRVNVQFLTPSLDVPLPPKSVVPYMEFPRYISQPSKLLAPGESDELVSQTITLPQIPDFIMVFAKPSEGYGANEGDWYFPIASQGSSGTNNPLRVNFDNFSGLLSSHTAEMLYDMTVHNGMDMDWPTWAGVAHSAGGSYPYSPSVSSQQGQVVPTVGSLLVLKPGVDITLQSGQASSLVGNFTLQLNLRVYNNCPVAKTPQLYIITANSGFFESIRGSSRIIKGVLSEQDIISAPPAPMLTHDNLKRMVGGVSLKGMLGKAMEAYHGSKGGAPAPAGAGGDTGAGATVGAGGRSKRSGESGLLRRLM